MNELQDILYAIGSFFEMISTHADEDVMEIMDKNSKLAYAVYKAFKENNLESLERANDWIWKDYKAAIEEHIDGLTDLIELNLLDATPEKLALVLHNLSINPKEYLYAMRDFYKHTDTGEQQELGEI